MKPVGMMTPRPTAVAAIACVTLLAGGCAESAAPLQDAGLPGDVVSGDDSSDQRDSECPDDACEPGESRCAGPAAVVRCIEGADGCGTFQMPTDCQDGQTCRDGRCGETGGECTDGDGDGYGPGCAMGSDCDNSNPDVHSGADEVCGDGIDNDCDGEIDEECDDPCAAQPCNPGAMRCNGDQVEVCEHDADGCGRWSDPMSCPSGRCENDRCTNCVDNDGDGYGQDCPSGPDCDDNDDVVHDGAREMCDDKDNDCDGEIDETYPDVGTSCTVGRGICEQTGTIVCGLNEMSTDCTATAGTPDAELCGDGLDNDCDGDTDEGFGIVGQSCSRGSGECQTQGTFQCDPNDATTTFCDAPDPSTQGSREICDNTDNDCDGSVDENNVCSTCIEDGHEPNDSSTTGTGVGPASTVDEVVSCGLCSSQGSFNPDWYDLGVQPSTASVTIELSHLTGTNAAGDQYADLDAEFFCGAQFCDAIRGTSATTQRTFDGNCPGGATCNDNVRWTIRVYPRCTLNPDGNPPSGTPYDVTRR